MKLPLFEFAMLIFTLLLIAFAVIRLRKSRRINMLNASLTVEELEVHAKRAALTHTVTSRKNTRNWPINRVNDNYDFIKSLYKDLRSVL